MAKKKIGQKGTHLVLGQLERISSTAFDRHRNAITDLVGGKNGIYALYRNNQLYYVGLATDLRRRVNQHLKDRHAGRWNFFSLYLVRSERHLKDLESLIMRIAFPKGNRKMGRFGKAVDLRPILQKKMVATEMGKIAEIMGGTPKPNIARKRAAKKAVASRKAAGAKVALKGLLKLKVLRATYKGKMYRAWVLSSGRIRMSDSGKIFDSPSGAAKAVRKKATNGWSFWSFRKGKGKSAENWVALKTLR